MKGNSIHIVIVLACLLVVQSCFHNAKTTSQGEGIQGLIEMKETTDSSSRLPAISIFYPQDYIGDYLENEYLPLSGAELLHLSQVQVYKDRGWYSLYGPLQIDNPIIVERITYLLNHLGVVGSIDDEEENDRFRAVAEMVMILEYNDRKEIVGIGWGPESAFDSSKRGILYPCPELFDIIVSCISDSDPKWQEINKDKFSLSPMSVPWRKLPLSLIKDRVKNKTNYSHCDSIKVHYRLCYNSAGGDYDSVLPYNRRTIRSFYSSQNNIIEIIIHEPRLICRIVDRLSSLSKVEQGDNRFYQRTQFTIVLPSLPGLDTLGIGEAPFDAISSTRFGLLYPDPELYLILANYLILQDPDWFEERNDCFNGYWEKKVLFDIKKRYGISQ